MFNYNLLIYSSNKLSSKLFIFYIDNIILYYSQRIINKFKLCLFNLKENVISKINYLTITNLKIINK